MSDFSVWEGIYSLQHEAKTINEKMGTMSSPLKNVGIKTEKP
jgi:hypothetical protein